ncbi:MAG: di-heme oxidoredictase family protein [Planctomycetota bacterium]
MSTHPLTNRVLVAAALAATTAFAFLPDGEDPAVTRGRELFDHAFRIHEGVGGPGLNADSCRACHRDPMMGGAGGLELNVTRFGFDNNGQGPFQNLPGGQGASRLYPPITPLREEIPANADCFEQRQTPSLLGFGLVDAIPEAAIVAHEDPFDLDQDGITGVARRVTVNGATEIGRFGWKAQLPRLEDFVHDATFNELGITTPDPGRHFSVSTDTDAVADPEISLDRIGEMTAFIASLPAPARGNSTDPRVAQGEQVFTEVGCAKCHIPSLPSPSGPVQLYSDLLLHHVWPPEFRGMAEPDAESGVYRTSPLWGIKDTAPYLHDGRAENLVSAIQFHDGEAANVRNAFFARSAADRQALILFLRDL